MDGVGEETEEIFIAMLSEGEMVAAIHKETGETFFALGSLGHLAPLALLSFGHEKMLEIGGRRFCSAGALRDIFDEDEEGMRLLEGAVSQLKEKRDAWLRERAG